MYTIIKVVRDEDLVEQIGKCIYLDLVDHDKVHSFRIRNSTPFNIFKKEVARQFGVPVQYQRFWLWAKRENQTIRPDRTLTVIEEELSVGQVVEASNYKANNAELNLFLEIELGPDMKPITPPDKTNTDILLFLKLYDPLKDELRYIGRLFAKIDGKPCDILSKLNEMAGFSADEEIDLYEELEFDPEVMFLHIDKKSTFCASQLQDGDIVCLQKSNVASEQCRHLDVVSFFEYIRNRQEEFSEFDTLFADIHNLLEPKVSMAKSSNVFGFTEIAEAENVFKQCINMDLDCIIQSGKAHELKNSLAVILSSSPFPENIADMIVKFVEDFDQRLEKYEASQCDLVESQENEQLVNELRTNIKKMVSDFIPVRSEAEAIDRKIFCLEKTIKELKAQKALVMKRAEEMAALARTSREALVRAEQNMKLFMTKKEQAEKAVNDFNMSWESLKELHKQEMKREPST